ncbi:MAG: hypothetical protein NT080_14120 [Spirochaetes bacterium]|nr:hypothetical protein [Spirochaetota bacterium]
MFDRILRSLAAFAFFVVAARSPAAEPSIAISEQAALVVGIAELKVDGGNEQLRSFAIAIPSLLLRRISSLPFRRMSPEETASVDERTRLRALYAAGSALAAARRKLDTVPFSRAGADRQAADRVLAETDLRAKRAALDKLVRASIRDTGGNTEKRPERYVRLAMWKGHQEGRFVPESSDILKSMSDNRLDILITGTVRPVGGYALVGFDVWSSLTSARIVSFENFAFPDDPGDAVVLARETIERAVAGANLAILRVKPIPDHATMRLEGANPVVNIADGTFYCYRGGEYRLSTQAFGYESGESEVRAYPGSTTEIVVELSPINPPTFLVRTNPADARVYVSSSFAGLSPVDVIADDVRGIGEARLNGYAPRFFELDAGKIETIDVTLLKEVDRKAFGFKYSRDSFFDSLGRFVISLPVAVLSYGYFQLYSNAEQAILNDIAAGRLSLAESESARKRLEFGYWTSQTVFWAATATSAGFFVDAAFSFSRYMKTME